MSEARLILAGGGDENDSRLLDEIFARWTGEAGRLLYLPIALGLSNSAYDACQEWLRGVFEPLGVRDISMWTALRDHDPGELNSFTSIYIGGGNTFHLLDQLRFTAFDEPLRRFIEYGGVVYGGSAGAIVLGRDILTCAHMDKNSVGLRDTRGLDLVEGHAIWCHYEPSDDVRIFDYCRNHEAPVLALPERAGILVERGRMTAWGYDRVFRFDHTGKQVFGIAQ